MLGDKPQNKNAPPQVSCDCHALLTLGIPGFTTKAALLQEVKTHMKVIFTVTELITCQFVQRNGMLGVQASQSNSDLLKKKKVGQSMLEITALYIQKSL